MSKTQPIVRATAAATSLVLATLWSHAAKAEPINYDDFAIPSSGITFLDVTESSGTDDVPLYGAPHLTSIPLGLDFDPQEFVASGTNGAGDITDGQLNFTIMGAVLPDASAGISSVNLFERGDYTLVGVGTAATQVLGGAIINLKVTEVDGEPISPVSLLSNASVGFNLVASSGIVQPWSLGVGIDIDAALAGQGIPFTIGATKVEVSIDNTLTALSEPNSAAFIAKKDFTFSVVGNIQGVFVTEQPEPGSIVLGSLALCAFGLWSRRLRAQSALRSS